MEEVPHERKFSLEPYYFRVMLGFIDLKKIVKIQQFQVGDYKYRHGEFEWLKEENGQEEYYHRYYRHDGQVDVTVLTKEEWESAKEGQTMILKKRWVGTDADGYDVDIDIFSSPVSICVMEISGKDKPLFDYELPADVMATEVTFDPRYENKNIAEGSLN